MNVKLHTPKTMRAGSGFSSAKQFLLSLLATTVSIVLTFGTAAIIDNHKKASAKKEMVMMVISDFDKTIETLQKTDTALRESVRLQQELAIHPEHYDSLRYRIPVVLSGVVLEEYSETTEKIITTSIESFSTIADVNFLNEVSSFYMTRRKCREKVLDKLAEDIVQNPVGESLMSLMNVNFPDYALNNWAFLEELKARRDKCMQMMHVSEKDLMNFNKRQGDDDVKVESDSRIMEMYQEYDSCSAVIERARAKLKG